MHSHNQCVSHSRKVLLNGLCRTLLTVCDLISCIPGPSLLNALNKGSINQYQSCNSGTVFSLIELVNNMLPYVMCVNVFKRKVCKVHQYSFSRFYCYTIYDVQLAMPLSWTTSTKLTILCKERTTFPYSSWKAICYSIRPFFVCAWNRFRTRTLVQSSSVLVTHDTHHLCLLHMILIICACYT